MTITDGVGQDQDQAKGPGKRIAIAIELDHMVPWHHGCYQGILEYAEQAGWGCVVDPFLVGMTGQSGVSDYAGVVGRITADVAEAARDHGIPVVNHWRNSPVAGLPSVYFDYKTGARLAGEHLIANGFQRFGHVGISDESVGMLDVEGLTEAVTSHGFVPPSRVEIQHDFEATRDGVIRMRRDLTAWLSRVTPPIGVLVQSSPVARYLAQMCSEMGLKVPHDVAIVVQLGDAVITTSASPRLTMVESDYTALGYEAALMLDELMRGNAVQMENRTVEIRRLIVSESSDVFLSPDPMVTEAMRFIAGHCRQTLRVEDVAEVLNTSRRTLERRFDEVLSRSVYGEIARLRCDYIKRQLIETDRPLATIAEDCGFGSASHFTRFFKKESGMTPGAFRKHHHSQRAAQA